MKMNDNESLNKTESFPISVDAYIVSINEKTDGMLKHTRINIHDISKTSIGFISNTKLIKNYFYDIKITLWNTNEINTAIKIVKEKKNNIKYEYEAILIGLSKQNEKAINTYSLLLEKGE